MSLVACLLFIFAAILCFFLVTLSYIKNLSDVAVSMKNGNCVGWKRWLGLRKTRSTLDRRASRYALKPTIYGGSIGIRRVQFIGSVLVLAFYVQSRLTRQSQSWRVWRLAVEAILCTTRNCP